MNRPSLSKIPFGFVMLMGAIGLSVFTARALVQNKERIDQLKIRIEPPEGDKQ